MATRVLVIEDNQSDFELIQAHLTDSKKYHLEWSDHLAAGLAKQGDFDVVLLDLDLPDSRGEETLKTFLSKRSGMATIVLSGRDDEAMARKAIRLGARDYMVKGLDPLDRLPHQIMLAIEQNQLSDKKATPSLAAARAVIAPETGHLAAMAKHVAELSLEHGVAVLTLTRTPGEIRATAEALGADLDRIQFIDATPAPDFSSGKHANVIVVGSPVQLERMQMRVEVALGRLGEGAVVVIDSLDALSWHNGPQQTVEFLQVLINRVRARGSAVQAITKAQDSLVLGQVETFMDEEPLVLA